MKKPGQSFLLSIGSTVTFFALLLLVFWHSVKRGTEVGREIILVDFTNTVTRIQFKTEMGQSFQLIFKTMALSPYTNPGHVHLVNTVTKQIADFDTDSNYFWTVPTNSILQPESHYEMTVTFPPGTKPAMYVTLKWLQRVADEGK